MPETFNNLFKTPEDIILFALAVIILIVFLGCIYAFFRAIFLFIFSNGDEEKWKKAWNTIRYMVLGLFLTIMLLFLGPQIIKIFAPDDMDMSKYTAKNVFTKIGDVMETTVDTISLIVQNYPDGTADFSSIGKNKDTSYKVYEL